MLLFAGVLLAPAAAQAQSITLAWEPSPDTSVAGYTVHIGVNPGVFGQTYDVSGRSTTTFTFANAVPGTRYYFAVSAYNDDNVSSVLSNVVSYKINVGPTLAQPANQNGSVGGATTLQVSATDDGDPLTFTATGLPTGLAIAGPTGLISGTPTAAGTFNATVTVSDGALTDSRSFAWTIGPALTVTSLTSSIASPQVGGTPVVFTAAATGGVAPYEFRFSQTVGSTTTVVRNWSAANAFTWTAAQAGTYVITVAVRNAGVTSDIAQASRTTNFVLTPPPMSITGLSSSLASPQQVNTPITFATAATGGIAPYQYKYLLTTGTTTTTVRNWSTNALFTWTPTQANSYGITVWVRSAGQTADAPEATRTSNFTITGPFTLTAITSSLASPRPLGTSITFTAVSTGGATPHQYKWWVHDGVDWRMVRDWAPGTFTWTPTQAGSNYRVSAWARPGGSTANDSTYNLAVPYVITAPDVAPPPAVTSLASSVPSPQVVGTSVTFTAAATGGTAPYQYKFWVSNGSTWTIVRDWNGSNTYTWTPTQANSNYRVSVWVRNATTLTDTREADLTVPYVITPPASAPPLTVTALTSSVPSPQLTGASITFTAGATGGTAPYQYKFWVWNGSTWNIVRDWNGSNSYTWTPTQANAGYRLSVWVRNATTTADVRDGDRAVPYVINAPTSGSPLTVTGLTSSVPSPQVAGTSVTFTASATGGTAPYQYKFWVADGSAWTIARDWNGSNSFTWTPTRASNNYRVAVWVRNATTTADVRDGDLAVPFPITAPASGGPLTVTSLTSNLPSPQVAGTPVTFTASAIGGAAPHQYKFWVWNGAAWNVVRDWSGSSSYTWTPMQAGSSYRVSVWVRNATTTADVRDGDLTVGYVVNPPAASAPLTVTSLTSDVASPQVVGTPITFTAAASGGRAPYQYKFWVWNGVVWTVVRDWNGSNSYTWTPTQAGSSYRVSVWVRNSTTMTDTRDGDLAVPFIVRPAGTPGALTVTSLTSNLPSPQVSGTSITFTANATGGVAPYQYKFFVWNGTVWTVVRDWNGSNSFSWTPSQGNSGYRVAVWVRNATTATDTRDGDLAVPYMITSSALQGPLSFTLLISSMSAPQRVGTTVNLTAVPSGGSGSYQYKWWLWDGIGWSVIRDWNSSSTYAWTPPTANPNYRLGVWVREATSTVDSSAINATMWFAIQP